MLFNSLEFLSIFLPGLLVLFGILQKTKLHLQTFLLPSLVIGSLVFYAYHSIADLALMIVSIVVNFTLGKRIYRQKKLLFIGLFFNIGLICYFKYASFILDNVGHLFSLKIAIEHIALPLGISFFTFQQIAYLVDAYHTPSAERDFSKYALLVSFFPHSIAGPLVQYKEIKPQFDNIHLSTKNFAIGLTIFIIGLFKKVVIADGLAPCANIVFDTGAQGIPVSFAEGWFGCICYTLQLYFDFSGYSDMAIGLAKVFNIQFPLNFDSPYQATSIIEFWRRWHITLSNFLRNYLYIPLGGNRHGVFQKYRNLFLTMLVGGLWHGANWTFVLWGSFHGILLIINNGWQTFCKKRSITFTHRKPYRYIAWSITMFCVVIAWVLFKSKNMSTALTMYKSMFGFNGISLPRSFESSFSAFSIFRFKGIL